MGTSNFYNVNAKNVFVYEPEEFHGLEFLRDDLDYFAKESNLDFFASDSLTSDYDLSGFPAVSLGSLDYSFNYLNIDFTIEVKLFYRCGYYEAGNLDYEISIYYDNDSNDNVDDVISDIERYWVGDSISKGLWAIHKHNLENKLCGVVEKLIDNVEDLYKKVASPYTVTAQFSNGETWYAPAESVA
jgi:hypothetical protein